MDMPTFNELAWTAFLFYTMGMNKDYVALMRKKGFLDRLRYNAQQLNPTEIGDELLKGFLNKWRCRVENNERSRRAVKEVLIELPKLRVLSNDKIETIDLRDVEKSSIIRKSYYQIRNMGHHFGPTATSKLLHVINPSLFIMWDKEILDEYHRQDRRITGTSKGYVAFLEKMKQIGEDIIKDFNLIHPNDNLALYLSQKMGYDPPESLAKYLDEYNWVVITNEVKVPPRWHPCDEKFSIVN